MHVICRMLHVDSKPFLSVEKIVGWLATLSHWNSGPRSFSCLRLEPFVEVPNAQDLTSPTPAVVFVGVNLSESH